jgi:hypothetical protein
MQQDNLIAIAQRKYVMPATDSRHDFEVYLNLAARMEVTAVNQLWMADITYPLFRTVHSIVQWCDKLGVELDHFYARFVFPAPLYPSIYGGRAIVGRRGRAILEIEAAIFDGQLCVCTIDNDPLNRGKIFCEDIIPHELMHILDVRQGRSPSVYPDVVLGEGEWLDLFRHLWIDGHLEECGFPHFTKEERIRELGEAVARKKLKHLLRLGGGSR